MSGSAQNREGNRRERGFVIPMTAALMVLLLPVVGLAIDAGVLYALKAKMSTAADAAAIAAARSLNVGLTLDAQRASAQAKAQAFFSANFRTGSWGTRNGSVTVEVDESVSRTRTVKVTAQLDAPQYFIRFLGFNTSHILAIGKASRRDVNLIVVLDRSGSMTDSVANGNACTTMKNASTNFVNMFAEGRDRLSLIGFGGSYYAAFGPATNFKTASPSILTQISAISCYGNTSTAMALWQAYQQLVTISEPGSLNLIVIFTDGYPNGVTANYPIRDQSDTSSRYGYSDGYYKWKASGTYGPYIEDTTQTACTSTGASCSMEPSPCQDAAGNIWDRLKTDTFSTTRYRRYNSTWNTNWSPGSGVGTAKTITGVLAQWAGDMYSVTNGDTAGLLQHVATSFSGSEPLVTTTNAPGCAFNSSYPGNNGGPKAQYIRRDVAYMPDTDIYGNSTIAGYKAVATYSSGPWSGRKRVDVPMAVTGASFNAADNAASRIRNDTTLKPVIYAIGLGQQRRCGSHLPAPLQQRYGQSDLRQHETGRIVRLRSDGDGAERGLCASGERDPPHRPVKG